jgi:serine protease Do
MIPVRKKLYSAVMFLTILAMLVPVFSCPPAVEAGQAKISNKSVQLLEETGRAMAEVAAAVRPAIVNISTTTTVKMSGQMNPFYNDPFFRRFFGEPFGHEQPQERKSGGLASGVIVSPDGYIITNNHVVKGADDIKVTLSDRREFKGKVVGTDPKSDIAVVKIDAKDLPTVPWGNSDALEVGDVVLAVGNPFGLNQTVTMGIVSATGRENVGITDYEDFIQTDAAINPGNSGGALVNARGQLVGINTAIYSTSGGYMGIGFAIPSNMVKTIMTSLIKTGKVVRGWLGVSIQRISPELASQFNLKGENGSLVSDVMESSPAEKAGMKRGDVIVAYDGKKADDPSQLRNMVAGSMPGEEHSVTVVRDGKQLILKVKIGELPAELQQTAAGEYQNVLKGIQVQDITPKIAKQLGIPARVKGVVVSDVAEDSVAAGVLSQGDVIQQVNRKNVGSVKEYQEIASKIKPDDTVLLLVFRGGSSLFITLSSK